MQKVKNCCSDFEYLSLISDILENKNFLKIKECRHHKIDRLEHSLHVSYYSYIITKVLGLNYKETARAGLLHDFFVSSDLEVKRQKFSFAIHPYYSLKNACDNFDLSALEKDIIVSHMFPMLPHKIPKYIESWIVWLVDNVVAIYEFYYSYGSLYFYKYVNIYLALLLIK